MIVYIDTHDYVNECVIARLSALEEYYWRVAGWMTDFDHCSEIPLHGLASRAGLVSPNATPAA